MRCWYSRWQLSNALDRGELDATAGRGHAAACAKCQAYATSLQALDARLREGAVLAPEPHAPPRRRMLIAPLVVAGAAAAAIAIGVRSSGHEPGDAPPIVATPAPPIDGARAIATRVTRALTAERSPLDTELDAIVEEGRRGLDAALLGLRRTD